LTMATPEILAKFEQRAVQAERMIEILTNQLSQLKAVSINDRKDEIRKSNELLRQEVQNLKRKLIDLETKNGVKQYYDFADSSPTQEPNIQSNLVQKSNSVSEKQSTPPPTEKKEKPKKEKKSGGGGGGGGNEKQPEAAIDVARLDFRVGKIVSAKKHPDAEKLYVEEVDVGEEKMRTVVSGLVNFIPEDEMQNRMVVLLCNLKPAKMRGITSEAMVMCASTPEKVEILSPPAGSEPGDVVEFDGYTRNPDPVLNPKKKVFEGCAPDLKTNSNKVACYKGVPFVVPGKGEVVSQTLTEVQIK